MYVAHPREEQAVQEESLALVEGAISGMVEFGLPWGTTRVDLLNGKGRLKRSIDAQELSTMELGALRSGTWTLRAHTPTGLVVRRIMVLDNGSIWALDPPSTRHRAMRRPRD